MYKVTGKLTVFFEEPFWVGVFERTENGKLSVCKVTFGAEPRDYDVMDFVQKNYFSLQFSPAVKADAIKEHANPKRAQREARRHTPLHRTFSLLLAVLLVHLVFDAATVYTVNHLDTVPLLLNHILHRLFIGTLVFAVFLFYQYIAILVEEETGKPRRLDMAARILLGVSELGILVLPIHFAITEQGNYSDGIHVSVCYLSIAIYLLFCVILLAGSWRVLDRKKKIAISAALAIHLSVSLLQALQPTWLISGMGLTLMALSFYLTLENPEILRGELVEQKMSMLYLKSQVNPHFLYNTLDTIRIHAQLNDDKPVADLLMRLVDFFRLSVKVDRQMVALDDELELLEAYMELMCYRYPQLTCTYDIDPDLGGVLLPMGDENMAVRNGESEGENVI